MAQAIPCDICGQEPGRWMLHDSETGSVQGVGALCFPLIGLGLTMAAPADYIDGVLAPYGYQPSKALKDQRKAEAAAEYDATQTIAEIVESRPVDDQETTMASRVAESVGPLVDKSSGDVGPDGVGDNPPH